jgi:hypothetical protein
MRAVSPSHRVSDPKPIWHWYDFVCPYCCASQDRSAVLRRLGLRPDVLPYPCNPTLSAQCTSGIDSPAVGSIG